MCFEQVKFCRTSQHITARWSNWKTWEGKTRRRGLQIRADPSDSKAHWSNHPPPALIPWTQEQMGPTTLHLPFDTGAHGSIHPPPAWMPWTQEQMGSTTLHLPWYLGQLLLGWTITLERSHLFFVCVFNWMQNVFVWSDHWTDCHLSLVEVIAFFKQNLARHNVA